MRLLYDLETNGLLQEVDRVHCAVVIDMDTKEIHRFRPGQVGPLLSLLSKATELVGQNIIGYDNAVLKKLYDWEPPKGCTLFDTMVGARVFFADVKESDLRHYKDWGMSGKLIGTHKLEAWGYRLGIHKGDYGKQEDAWDTFTEEMLEYCVTDCHVTLALYDHIKNATIKVKGSDPVPVFSELCLMGEQLVQKLLVKQMMNGYPFDEEKAHILAAKLGARKVELEMTLCETFGAWYANRGSFTPKVNNKVNGYTKDVPFTKIEYITFNPSSRDHIAERLIHLYKWEPIHFTESGKPMVDEETLKVLPYAPVKLLCEYLTVVKRLGQVSEGNQAWLRCVKGGFIYGYVNTNGAVTGRMTHAFPNVAQVPSVKAPYGVECRELWRCPIGWYQVGTDASGLELRCLAHFMARWDKGAYAQVLLTGDVHSANQAAAGLPSRDNAKTFIYAFLYGAGDAKIGSIIGKGAQAGKAIKAKFMRGLPALGFLSESVAKAAKKGFIKGLDGRPLYIRHAHAALNTLLQSAGALVCKRWAIELEWILLAEGYKHGWDGDFAFMANIHDELQIACRTKEIAERVCAASSEAMSKAEAFYNFRCPLATDSKIGVNWAECH